MTRTRIIWSSIGLLMIGIVHLALEGEFEPKERDPILAQVKREYVISCSQGQVRVDKYITCKDVKGFINRMESIRNVKNPRVKLVSQAKR